MAQSSEGHREENVEEGEISSPFPVSFLELEDLISSSALSQDMHRGLPGCLACGVDQITPLAVLGLQLVEG